MATKTENLGLNIWAHEDTLQMAQFNENNQNMEDKLGYMAAEPLFETSFSANATTVSIPMSGIDWSKYDYVVMDTVVAGTDTSYSNYWRVNGDSSESSGQFAAFVQIGSSLSTNKSCTVFTNGTSTHRRIIFKCYKNPARDISCSYDKELLQGWGQHTGVKFSAFNTFVISSSSSSGKIAKGGTVKIWGVKGCW